MNKIKFSHDYPKLHEQTLAVLLDIRKVSVDSLDNDFIEYDTKYYAKEGYGHYELPKNCDVIILVFAGDKDIPFTTVRRFTQKKYDWYFSLMGKEFTIVIEK